MSHSRAGRATPLCLQIFLYRFLAVRVLTLLDAKRFMFNAKFVIVAVDLFNTKHNQQRPGNRQKMYKRTVLPNK